MTTEQLEHHTIAMASKGLDLSILRLELQDLNSLSIQPLANDLNIILLTFQIRIISELESSQIYETWDYLCKMVGIVFYTVIYSIIY